MCFVNDMEELFNSIPTDLLIELNFNHKFNPITGIVINKTKHSHYSYSLCVISEDRLCMGYYWIIPSYSHYYNKRVTSFSIKKNG